MERIRSVNAEAGEGDGLSGVMLSVVLRNGQTILLSLASRADDPAYADLLADGRLFCPGTDGQRVFWPNGPSLSCDEILEMVRSDALG